MLLRRYSKINKIHKESKNIFYISYKNEIKVKKIFISNESIDTVMTIKDCLNFEVITKEEFKEILFEFGQRKLEF